MTHTVKHQKLTHFKTPTFCIILDSFQEPYIFHPNQTFRWMPSSELYQPSPKLLISRPSHQKTTAFKSPWETTFSDKLQIPFQQWNSDFLVKIRRKTHHVHLINSSQDASSAPPAFSAAVFTKTKFFQDPKNLTSTVHSSNHVQTLTHRLWHRTRTS